MLKSVWNAFLQTAQLLSKCILILGLTVFVAAKAPEIHNLIIREYVGGVTYMMVGTNGSTGTGFMIHAKSGRKVLVTNDHVCELGKNGFIRVTGNGFNEFRKILDRSETTDLCVLDGIDHVRGLYLSTEPFIGQTVTFVGHPNGRPLTIAEGEMIALSDVTIEVQYDKCTMRKLRETTTQELQDDGTKKDVKTCYDTTKDAYETSALIYPGNSGSPMVDFLGFVQGVAFASEKGSDSVAGTWQGWAINLTQLKEELDKF